MNLKTNDAQYTQRFNLKITAEQATALAPFAERREAAALVRLGLDVALYLTDGTKEPHGIAEELAAVLGWLEAIERLDDIISAIEETREETNG